MQPLRQILLVFPGDSLQFSVTVPQLDSTIDNPLQVPQCTVKHGSDIAGLLSVIQDAGSLHQRRFMCILAQYDGRKGLKRWSIEVVRGS